MPRISTRVYGPTSQPTGPTTLFTIATATTYIIRNIHVVNTTGSAATLTMSVGVDAATTELFTAKSVAANDVYDWYGPLTLVAAETLRTLAGTNNALTVTITADVLTVG